MKKAPASKAPVINLMTKNKQPPGLPVSPLVADCRTTVAQLQYDYNLITQANEICYPVPYHIIRELGRGRQGVVFLCLRQGARGCVTKRAIKVFDPALYKTSEEYWTDMGRIASQISCLDSVQSPYLVTRQCYEEIHGIGYVQMEVIDGIDLEYLLQNNHLEIAEKHKSSNEFRRLAKIVFRQHNNRTRFQPGVMLYILKSVVSGLERLHSQGFLHCDVKPSNIMIDKLGTVKLIDFGRGVMVGENVHFLLGAPMYMAPETHRRETAGVTTDLYSAGLVALEMLCGHKLVEEDIEENNLLDIKMKLPEKLDKMLPKCVRNCHRLVQVLRTLLHPDPRKRYQGAKEAVICKNGISMAEREFVKEDFHAEYSHDLADYISLIMPSQV
ncbi:serine/threonine protein kinase [Verrucomicrobiota bacterium]